MRGQRPRPLDYGAKQWGRDKISLGTCLGVGGYFLAAEEKVGHFGAFGEAGERAPAL